MTKRKLLLIINLGSVAGYVGSLFLIPASLAGRPLLISSALFLGFVIFLNFLAVARWKQWKDRGGQPSNQRVAGLSWWGVGMIVCLLMWLIVRVFG